MAILLMHQIIKEAGIFKILWKKIILLQWMWERHLSTRRVQTVPRSQALVSFKKYMPPPPLPYFKVNICPFPLPHFASIFFAYL